METKHNYNRINLKRYPGYQIDIFGNVWSLQGWRGIKEKQLIPHPNNFGYMRVTLKYGNNRKTEFVHNLMIENFIGNKDGLQVRHLDGDKRNNSLSNLKLGTAKENAEDRDNHKTTSKGELHSQIIILRKENERLKTELSSKLIAAAPDLLEALMELIKDCNPKDVDANKTFLGVKMPPDYVGSISIPSGKSIHKAINAINKATK